MKKTFLICSLTGRLDGLVKLISSLSRYSEAKFWDLVVVLQKYTPEELSIAELHCKSVFKDKAKIYHVDEMTGPHMARCIALDDNKSDVWCILDDDMWAVDKTDYETMANIVYQNKHIGLLSGNWRRNEKMIESVDLKNKLIKQDIVYTGGGMMFRQDVADIIKSIPRTMYVFDNPLWSIYSYVNGYNNYRFMGSVAVHNICTKGGRIKWLKENDKHKSLPPSDWIRTRKGKGGAGSNDEYLICDSSDITDYAKELHNKNLKD